MHNKIQLVGRCFGLSPQGHWELFCIENGRKKDQNHNKCSKYFKKILDFSNDVVFSYCFIKKETTDRSIKDKFSVNRGENDKRGKKMVERTSQ